MFQSPAQDYVDKPLSIDDMCQLNKPYTYILKSEISSWRAAIRKDALLILDCSATPYDGSIVMCHLGGQIAIRRLRLSPSPRLEDLDFPSQFEYYDAEDDTSHAVVKGVITHIINDARAGEFVDDCPFM